MGMDSREGSRSAAGPPDRPQSEGPYAGERPFAFPPWTNHLRAISLIVVLGGLLYVTVLLTILFSPRTTAVGYAPEQPVPYSHALHVGELGMDCRYCHTTVERAGMAALPPTSVCMNCHQRVRADSRKLLIVRESAATGLPVPWVRVHDLPDFVYFDHSAHLAAGVGCVSCHGRVDRMEVVQQAEPLNMAWCLSCHRHPEPNLRPAALVTDMEWVPTEDPAALGARLRQERGIHPRTDCSVCHR